VLVASGTLFGLASDQAILRSTAPKSCCSEHDMALRLCLVVLEGVIDGHSVPDGRIMRCTQPGVRRNLLPRVWPLCADSPAGSGPVRLTEIASMNSAVRHGTLAISFHLMVGRGPGTQDVRRWDGMQCVSIRP